MNKDKVIFASSLESSSNYIYQIIKNKKKLELEINKRKSRIIFKNDLFKNSTKKIVSFINLIMKN